MKKIRLLIVEDSPTVCVYLGLIFAEYDDIEIVAVAKNGREGINFTIDFRPDIVLMDLHMPEVDGFADSSPINWSTMRTYLCELCFKTIAALARVAFPMNIGGSSMIG